MPITVLTHPPAGGVRTPVPPLPTPGRWATTTLRLPEQLWWSDDQGVFNSLLTSKSFYPVRAAGLDGRLVHGPSGLVLAPLPAARFCSAALVERALYPPA